MPIPQTYIFKQMSDQFPVWIIDNYSTFSGDRTFMGDFVYQIKYLGNHRELKNLETVVRHVLLQLLKFPKPWMSMNGIDAVISVPPSPGSKNTLPQQIAEFSSTVLTVPDWSGQVQRIKAQGQAKLGNVALPSMFTSRMSFTNKRILIVDDVFLTGSTLNALATSLRLAGASSIVGLCLAKANQRTN